MKLFELRSSVKELRGIRLALERLADCWEIELAYKDIIVNPKNTGKPESTMDYTDEEMDWARENITRLKREDEELQRTENE